MSSSGTASVLADSSSLTARNIEQARKNLQESVTYHEKTNGKLMLIAHRGMGPTSILGPTYTEDIPPENTLKAFKQAMILGADGIELDIFLSKDAQVMVIHDNELWRNVYGIDRSGDHLPIGESRDTFDIREKTSDELKKLSVGPENERIPILSEVFDLASQINPVRGEVGLPPVILNIEIKDATAVDRCLEEIEQYRRDHPESGVDFQSISFCSFNHDALIKLMEKASARLPRIAPAIKTTLLFGEDSVDKMAGFKVKDGATYDKEGLKLLERLVVENGFSGYDAILWDIYEPLIDLAVNTDKELHASTSDFRDYREYMEKTGARLLDRILEMSDRVKLLMFKCDDIGKVKALFLEKLSNDNMIDLKVDWARERLLERRMAKPDARLPPGIVNDASIKNLVELGLRQSDIGEMGEDKINVMLSRLDDVKCLMSSGVTVNDFKEIPVDNLELALDNSAVISDMLSQPGLSAFNLKRMPSESLQEMLRAKIEAGSKGALSDEDGPSVEDRSESQSGPSPD